MKYYVSFWVFLFLSFFLSAQSNIDDLWEDVNPNRLASITDDRWIIVDDARTVYLDVKGMTSLLKQAPLRTNATNALTISIPMPDRTTQRFSIVETPTMEPRLAVRFPDIKTYSGIGVDDPHSKIYLDITPTGLHAMILSPSGSVYIDPYFKESNEFYTSYYTRDFKSEKTEQWSCQVRDRSSEYTPDNTPQQRDQVLETNPRRQLAAVNLRTYRTAIATTREFTAFHGGTKAGGLAAVVTTLNRVKGVYETELGISFTLVSNNDDIIYTGADPYTNGDNAIDQNQANLDNVIGVNNYDIGHVFTTSSGLAGLGVVCGQYKAEGTTGIGSPTGDPFDIDYVAHEIGHQLGGNHTFNGSTGACSGANRNGTTAYEPGSGSTIQAYAGICGNQDLQDHSDAYFHLISLMEMKNYTTTGDGNSCGAVTNNVNNTPTADANSEGIDGKFIPISTPFEVTGAATDPDGDPLTYNWEQWDLGPQGNISATSTTAVQFRSFQPTTSPTRTFPKLADILNNTTSYGEVLPSRTRDLKLQFIARDNKLAGGGFSNDLITLKVTNTAGPFRITNRNTSATISGSTTIAWDVANTDQGSVNCPNVEVLLSTDGGMTFPLTLLASTPNDGNATISLPNINTTTARIKVKCADNVFFDINDANLTITPGQSTNCIISDISAGTQTACDGNNQYTQEVIITHTDAPDGSQLIVNTQHFPIATSPQTVVLTGLPANAAAVNITANISTDINCARTENNVFTAPSACVSTACVISSVTAGTQTSCAGNNQYTQQIIVTFANAPSSGTLLVNGQSFSIGNSSPQTITLTGLTADGAAVNVTASFSMDSDCTKTVTSLFTAPVSCTASTCTTYTNTTSISIPEDEATTILSTINVPSNKTITDVNVIAIHGTHEYIFDLVFKLTSPDGTTVTLIQNECFDLVSFNQVVFSISLDDEATTSTVPCPIESITPIQPLGNLSDFNGENALGDWVLSVEDDLAIDGGVLNGWSLEICGTSDNPSDPCAMNTLAIDDRPIASETYHSGGTITSTGVVEPSSDVTFKAPSGIRLLSGFNAKISSIFLAKTEACVIALDSPVAADERHHQTTSFTQSALKTTQLTIFPNPFRETFTIDYSLPNPTSVTIDLFNVNGQKVATLVNQQATNPGRHKFHYDGQVLEAGLYYINLRTERSVETKQVIVIK